MLTIRRHGGWPCFAGGAACVFGARPTLTPGPFHERANVRQGCMAASPSGWGREGSGGEAEGGVVGVLLDHDV